MNVSPKRDTIKFRYSINFIAMDLTVNLACNIFTAYKRSLGQGNVFTGVCLSTWGHVCLWDRGGGICLWVWGCASGSRGRVHSPPPRHTPSLDTHTPPGNTHPRHPPWSTSGRYASYWYAFVSITTCKRSLRRLCFYTCLSVILFTGGALSGGVVPGPGGYLLPGGCLVRRGGLLRRGAWWRPPPGRLLLRAVRILLECILVFIKFVICSRFLLIL